ncbi:hypothetical protein CY34DRAFT_757555 [Suillus luteus UH-Slu-Lm8-n1]|uniref:Midasin n=1 Tax=Suillus luteus UH-Slu-Lm8-n1 TaxID=930992 RepID=A0A0D0A330_9AGAM|nr:hypothetical protein CY34DRAFT_757555 [Suillus luteus UH-Slu-Lm8-n1]
MFSGVQVPKASAPPKNHRNGSTDHLGLRSFDAKKSLPSELLRNAGMSTGASLRPFVLHKPALLLLSRISTALALSEPVLLTGETGTGKTSAVTYLASLLRRPLISLNLSHQTEASDLLGGFRPVVARVRESELFGGTFSRKQHAGFEDDGLRTAVREGLFGLRRALWEGMTMAFTMVLDGGIAEAVTQKHILVGVRNPRSFLGREPNFPPGRSVEEFIKFGPFHLEKGPLPEDPMEEYIMTPSVEKKLIDLARIGPTSAGKTSAVEYLARRTGHRFIRINNHEHTDVQEYLGSHVSDPATGELVFKYGPLVHALRHGHWIVLDELNLAPTDVLEALDRLLDDNWELVVPETQEVIRPHQHFMLFATQNPPGLYAGRKVLSRAFRNRPPEAHFRDAPQAELESILCQRCRIAPSYGQKIVGVFRELKKRRQLSRVFESKQGFAILRDLFRWACRNAVGHQALAENGYMLLAERARREDDSRGEGGHRAHHESPHRRAGDLRHSFHSVADFSVVASNGVSLVVDVDSWLLICLTTRLQMSAAPSHIKSSIHSHQNTREGTHCGRLACPQALERADVTESLARPDEVKQVVVNRSGSILSACTILKSDFFCNLQKMLLPERIEGSPNFRHVPLTLKLASSQPSSHINPIDEKMMCGSGMPTVQSMVYWTPLREVRLEVLMFASQNTSRGPGKGKREATEVDERCACSRSVWASPTPKSNYKIALALASGTWRD